MSDCGEHRFMLVVERKCWSKNNYVKQVKITLSGEWQDYPSSHQSFYNHSWISDGKQESSVMSILYYSSDSKIYLNRMCFLRCV